VSNANKFFDTGVDDNETPLAPGAVDPHWKLIQAPGLLAPADVHILKTQATGGYFSAPNSLWVWSDANGAAEVGAYYVFQQRFYLEFEFEKRYAQLSARWGADNYGFITINGVSPATGGQTPALPWFGGELSLPQGQVYANFNQPHSFFVNNHFHNAFHLGWNTLEITVINEGVQSKANPAGFNVTGAGIYIAQRPETRQPRPAP